MTASEELLHTAEGAVAAYMWLGAEAASQGRWHMWRTYASIAMRNARFVGACEQIEHDAATAMAALQVAP